MDGGPPAAQGAPPAYLLKIDRSGIGRAIVALGNPDTAEHTAVYVPGTTSNLSNVGGELGRMESLRQKASFMAPGQQVAAVTWLGYNAPQNIVTQSPCRTFADHAAPDLDHFVTGLRSAHQGAPSHITAVGHSYGTTVIGSAAIHGHLDVNDIVVAGSPGMEVQNAADLKIGAGHVWAEAAPNDPVPPLGLLASNLPSGGLKVERWHGIPYTVDYQDGIPTDPYFGGHVMATNTSGHSGYWNAGSESLANQAAVVSGNYDQVTARTWSSVD